MTNSLRVLLVAGKPQLKMLLKLVGPYNDVARYTAPEALQLPASKGTSALLARSLRPRSKK